MRYRIGETPPEPGLGLEQGPFLAMAVLSLVIGAGFIVAGIRSKHYWMTIWGTGLVIVSIVYVTLISLSS